MTIQRNWRLLLPLLLLGAGLISRSLPDKQLQVSKNVDIFSDILTELDQHYIDPIDPNKTAKQGIDAMLATLDPYSSFLSEETLENFKVTTQGAYGGIGAIIGRHNDKNIVMMPYKDQPAHLGGVHAGDEILQINGEDMHEKSIEAISGLLKGMPDTSVQMTIQRPGISKPIELTLNRKQVTLKNVPYYAQIKPGVGYIKLVNFSTHAAEEVKTALKNLKEQGAKRIILDLRNNPGGLLDEAIRIANLFISQHLPIVTTRGKNGLFTHTYTTQNPPYDTTMPLAIMINEGSASASEIIAGAIQDHDRGILIGQSTYGKGLVQMTRPISHNTELKMTICKYYVPSGRSIYKKQKHETKKQEETPKKKFTTAAGRIVREGNGIVPDIAATVESLSPIAVSLLHSGLIFDYATIFQAQQMTQTPQKDFTLSNKAYKHFVAWLNDKQYTYTIEPLIDHMAKYAEEENYTDRFKKQIAALEAEMRRQKIGDLQRFRSEIKRLLQQEIIGRYHFQEGQIEASIPYDKPLRRACAILQSDTQYKKLLSPPQS